MDKQSMYSNQSPKGNRIQIQIYWCLGQCLQHRNSLQQQFCKIPINTWTNRTSYQCATGSKSGISQLALWTKIKHQKNEVKTRPVTSHRKWWLTVPVLRLLLRISLLSPHTASRTTKTKGQRPHGVQKWHPHSQTELRNSWQHCNKDKKVS